MFAPLVDFVRIQGDIEMCGRADDKIKALEGIDQGHGRDIKQNPKRTCVHNE